MLARNWLGDASTALPSIMAMMIWFQIGYPLVIFMAALQRIDPELYEAAALDGASWFQRFFHITIHLIRPEISIQNISVVLTQMKQHLKAASAHLELSFPYFIEKRSPVSKSPGLMDYNCSIVGASDPEDNIDLMTEVVVPISSVCPCSKEISEGGAHNQRGEVRLATRFKRFIWLEDMIELVESCASCEVYSILKRVDEKEVTEKGFDNPKFVEDIVRDVAHELKQDPNITWFSVSAENFESIHNHSAYAQITG
jgi:GTP cyclohydrolase I